MLYLITRLIFCGFLLTKTLVGLELVRTFFMPLLNFKSVVIHNLWIAPYFLLYLKFYPKSTLSNFFSVASRSNPKYFKVIASLE